MKKQRERISKMNKLNYGFDLDWFLSNSKYRDVKKLDYFYDKYYLDYQKFIESLEISKEEKEKCLKSEKKCLKCKTNYPYNDDSFVHIMLDNKDITKELCYDCIQNILKCVKCEKSIDCDPYTKIDFYNENLSCKKCGYMTEKRKITNPEC